MRMKKVEDKYIGVINNDEQIYIKVSYILEVNKYFNLVPILSSSGSNKKDFSFEKP